MKTFEAFDISGDAGIKGYGTTPEDLFINMALGMYSLITDPSGVEEKRRVDVDIKSPSMDSLLVSWLNELIFQFDTYGFIGRKIVITHLSTPESRLSESNAWGLRASLSGEDFDAKRHERRLLIKAATYHRLKIREAGDGWEAEVVFDI